MMVAVDFSPRAEGVFWSRVAERRLKATVLFDRSTVAPRRRIVCSPRSVGLSPRLPSLSRSARRGQKSNLQRAELESPRSGRQGRAPVASAAESAALTVRMGKICCK